MATRVITIIGFACMIIAIFALEIIGRRRTNRIPTLGEWLGFLMRAWAGRVLILLGWLWLGWHYFAR
jgi:hypothetical protein